MQMLLRCFVPALLAAATAAQGDGEPSFTRSFGEAGAPGSMRARFVRAGAGLAWLQLSDHARSVDRPAAGSRPEDNHLLLVWNGNDHALRLAHAASPAPALFPVEPAEATWTVADGGSELTFTLDGGQGLELEKKLRYDARQRGFVLELALRNKTANAAGSLDLVLGGPMPVSPAESSLFGTLAVAIAAAADGTLATVPPKAGPPQPLAVDPAQMAFAGSTNRFFAAFLWPLDDSSRAALGPLQVDAVPLRDDPDSLTHAFTSTRVRYPVKLEIPAQNGETRLRYGLYFGPKSYRVFATLPEPERFAPVLEHDLNAPCCVIEVPGGRPMAKLLLWLMGIFHDVVGNWGIAIIMLTILVRGLLAPLNFKMQKSMRAYGARMAVLKPKMEALKKQHGDDQRAYQQAMIAFQREHKLMPPLGGCLPIFLTMPIYIGLFTALRTAYDLRHQPFASWIDDLSRPDGLFALGFWPHQFNLLPILWIALMVVQTLRTPLPTDPQQRQQMMIMRYMPLIFGVMLYYYAAGLLVYMVTSMLWSMVEYSVTQKILGPVDPNIAGTTPQMI
ncbi:MAG: membrane protein insertase YidC [Planctomycetota bacterium]